MEPIAVFITDTHFTLETLEQAKVSFLRAQFKAKMLDVPLVVGGDTLNTKAVMRAEVVNCLLDLVSVKDAPETIFLCGNHEMINERSKEHSLHFLKPYAVVIDTPQLGELSGTDVLLIPYQTEPENFMQAASEEEYSHADIVIGHQGLKGASPGEYILDRTAVEADQLPNKKYIIGHYHTRQTVELKQGGTWIFTGNPYSLNFAESGDLEKGFHIIMDDGSLEFVPTMLRKHIVVQGVFDADGNGFLGSFGYSPGDLMWVKISAPKEALSKYTKDYVRRIFLNNQVQNFRLDLIPTDMTSTTNETQVKPKSNSELLDSLIDLTNTTDECKLRLKDLWKDLA